MRVYRPNMERVPYGGRAAHPEHVAEYELAPEAVVHANLKKADADLTAVQQRISKMMASRKVSDYGMVLLQSAYRNVGIARGDLDAFKRSER